MVRSIDLDAVALATGPPLRMHTAAWYRSSERIADSTDIYYRKSYVIHRAISPLYGLERESSVQHRLMLSANYKHTTYYNVW